MNFRHLGSVSVFLLMLVLGGGETSSIDSEHVPCSSIDDPRLASTCQLTGKFGEGYKCYVSPGVHCQGVVHAGQGSVCIGENSRASGGREAFKCLAGIWTSIGENSQEEEATDATIVKRGLRFRVRIRWRRTACKWGLSRRCGSSSPSSSPPPNKPPQFTSCPTVPPQKAESGTLQKTVSWPAPVATDPDGGAPSVSVVSGGPQSGGVFNEGNTAVMYKARDSQGATDYCIVNVQVQVVYCPRAQYLQHGQQTCSGARHNVYGSVCTHTCNTGYELQGSPTVTCQSSGTWNPPAFPTCQPVSCGPPASVSGAQLICPSGHVFPQLCVISCDAGYMHTGAPFVTCRSDRSWSQASPCQDVQAPSFTNGCPANQQLYSGPLESPVSVTWPDPVALDNSGQGVTLSSSLTKGSLLGPGFHIVRVTATDRDQNSASCNFVVTVQARKCTSFLAPPNGHVTCTRGYVEGSECTVTCNPGYQLRGDATLQCLDTELWNATSPTCDIQTCPTPSPVTRGSWTCLGGHGYQSVCVLDCDPGFTVQGSRYSQCLANATWSAALSSCVDGVAPVFTNTPCHDNVEVYASRVGLPTVVTWSDPPVTDNSGAHVTLVSDVTSGASFPVGVTRVTYVASDASGNSANCSFTVTVTSKTCGAPDLELANRSRTLMLYNCPDGYVYGSTCTLSCTHNYPLLGATNITCQQDNRTHPPTMQWEWPDPHLGKPVCRENNCSALAAPINGALACYLADFGKYCLMSCEASWDVPAQTDGRFLCTNSNAFWVPSVAPDCIVRVRPGRVRVMSDMFYYTGSCQTNLDALRASFVSRLSNSTWKDACVNVPSCVPGNVEVTCGAVSPGKKKRSVDDALSRYLRSVAEGGREKRQATSHYVLITFDIVMDYEEGSASPQQVYQEYSNIAMDMYSKLMLDADAGLFNIGGLVTDSFGVGYPTTSADCPPGTFFQAKVTTTSFSCAGCGAGWYLPVNATQCQTCEVGRYTGLDNATSCSLCPPGWSTPTTGSHHVNQCHVAL